METEEDPAAQARASLLARLQNRSIEIEQEVLTRVNSIGGATESDDPDYLFGFIATVPAAIEYGLSVIESGDGPIPPVPTALLTQARMAARHSISLDTVVRRYVAGRDQLSQFLIEEVEGADSPDVRLTSLLATLSEGFDQLLAQVGEEYALELRRRPSSTQARQAERVKRVLDGEQLDTSDLSYDLEARHLGLVSEGDGAPDAVRALAKALDGRLLLVHPDAGTVWAWIGLRDQVDRNDLDRFLATNWPAAIPMSLSEQLAGRFGWRLANKQAKAVFPFAVHHQPKVVRYADDALLTAMARDEVLTASLRELYLAPLETGREGCASDREILGAYFASGRNGRAAAAALRLSRQTVSTRLRSIEARIGRSLLVCATDLELALRLADRELI